MDLSEALNLMKDLRVAEANEKTPVGAAKSLQRHLGKGCGALIGPCLPDGRFALYASSASKSANVPNEWCGFPVINLDNKEK